jgi:hypothetical protein
MSQLEIPSYSFDTGGNFFRHEEKRSRFASPANTSHSRFADGPAKTFLPVVAH